MSNGYNLGQADTLSPEMFAQQQDLNRQQRMAQMLMQQGQQAPQGQMISGRYVAPSIFQNLASLAQTGAGAYLQSKGDEKALDLAKQLREEGKLETQRLMNVWGGTEGQPGDAKLAFAEALNMNSPQARALLPRLSEEAFKKPKWEKASFTDGKTGRVREGVIDINAANPIATFQIGGVKPEMSAYERASLNMRGAELADQGIPGYGAPVSMPMGQPQGRPQGVPQGQPMGQPMGQPQAQPMGRQPSMPTGQAMPVAQSAEQKFTPAVLPTYQYNPDLSPRQNREQALEFSKQNQKNIKNAQESFDTLKSASQILSSGLPSSGRLENIATGVREFFGSESEQAKADSRLTILAQKLTQQVPRFEGPQSNVDVASYQAAAGDLGNPNKTIGTRLAAAQTMVDLNKKYYPNGDWDSIDLGGPITTRQTFLKGEQRFDPATFSQGLNPQDREAFNWARRNPTDPRAAQINQRLGIR
jgi:hypothetical protein